MRLFCAHASQLSTRYLPSPIGTLSSRFYSPGRPTTLKPRSVVYVSKSVNPYFNLTLEDWLFRHSPADTPLLLLYRNSPCVVIGRNQNPWKEVNLQAAKQKGIPWIRRRSGGGTVFHDFGNTNYSIHVPRAAFDRTKTAEVVVRAVRALEVDAYANERNDICVGSKKMSSFHPLRTPLPYRCRRHVSGSAYKIVSNRAYHHGTMLISTRLDTLGDLLHVDKPTMSTKGVGSVRSPVCNLVESNPRVTHEALVDSVIKSFREEYRVTDQPCVVDDISEYLEDEYFKSGMSELPGWDWAYGQTPEFEYAVEKRFEWGNVTATIRSKHGVILSCDLMLSPSSASVSVNIQPALDELGQRLEGRRYGFIQDMDIFSGSEDTLREMADSEVGAVWRWLKVEMSA